MFGCSSSSPVPDPNGSSDGGTKSAGGATSSGGSATNPSGGAPATGGVTTTSGQSNPSTSTGGTSSVTAAGGGSATSNTGEGGASSGGKSSASSTSAGGSSSKGGTTAAAGGSSSKGGTTSAVSGSSSKGGAASPGGGSGKAGNASTGGATNNAGASSKGGSATGGGNATAGTTSAGGEGKSSGCGQTPTIKSSQYNNGSTISITAGSQQRRYILNVPTNYDNTHPYRLIVVYHQLDGNDKQMYNWQYYGLLPLSNNSTIFVAPNGQKNGSPCSGTGDGDSGCGWPNTSDSDLALADAVVAQIEENFCIDTNRIFATGWSYGGSMSYRTGCSRPLGGTGSAKWGVRGIAIYSAAQLSGNCTPTNPVAFYASHGTHDSVLNYDSMGLPLAQNFAKVNGCTWATPTKVSSGTHVCTNLTGCTTGYPLEFCSFNGDHTPYPDNGQSSGSWGPQEAWKFLSQF